MNVGVENILTALGFNFLRKHFIYFITLAAFLNPAKMTHTFERSVAQKLKPRENTKSSKRLDSYSSVHRADCIH